ncbi:PKD domain-containing protein [Roseivirga sp.]|uniref:PKD domain-containing protein n=1 Tax=Roseivirga sp. TaxID=1964215 RepID=UPI003B52B215
MNLRLAGFLLLVVTNCIWTDLVSGEKDPVPTIHAISITANVSDETCLGDNDGSIDITVSGGVAPYTFSWSNGETSEDLSNLAPGSYTITVTDDNGDTQSETYTVNDGFDLFSGANSNPKPVTCVNGSDGTLQLVITAGTGPYTYDWRDEDGNQVGTNSLLKDVTVGLYTVTITGFSNGGDACTASATYLITEPAPKFTIDSNITNVSCNGGSDGAIDLTVTSPDNGNISFNWSIGESSEDISSLPAGDYEVEISQGKHCEIHTFTVAEPDVLTLSTSQTNVFCGGDATGSIDLSVAGGTAPYTYSWNTGATSQDLGGLAAGDYDVTVTDDNGCTATTSVTITQPAVLALSTSQVNVLCNGDATGSIDLTVSGGTGSYSFAWSNGQTTEDLSGLPAGDYDVIVTDDNGCTETVTVTITQPAVLALSVIPSDVLCNGEATGSVDLTVTGGAGGYTYDWDNGANTEDLSGVAAGTYEVIVTDANGCTATISTTVNEPAALSISATQVDVLCNGDATGSIDLTVSGGAGGNTYLWSNGVTSQDLNNLTAGSYSVTVTDANGCTASTSVTINEPSALTVSTTSTNVTCQGDGDGTIDLTVSGGTGAYTYFWNSGATSQDLSNLGPGTYSVTVTDDNGCTATTSVTINEPDALSLSIASTNVLCNGEANGTIDLTVTGGTGPFTYSWSNGAGTEDLTGLSANTYIVNVTDANGCIASTSVVISEPAVLSLSTSKTDVLCNGAATGDIDLSVSGGSVGYSYLWSNGATTQDLNNVVAGTYSVTVTDANGCTASTSVTITEPTALTLSSTQTNVSCKGDNDGSIDLSVTGGTGAYSFSWSNGATSEDISALVAGSYTVTVTDGNGCTATTTISITEPATLISASYTQVNVLCNGDATGSIDLTVSNATAPISYAWSNGAVTEDLTNISAGTYDVTITDALGCITVSNIVITEPTALALVATKTDIDCNGNTNGSIDLSVSGGVGPYTYAWTNGASSEDISGLAANLYSVTVTDANGCTASTSVTISEPAVLALNTSKVDVTCNGGSDGSIDLSVSGGTAPYSYAWGNGETTEDLSNIAAGTYTVVVTDFRGCTDNVSVTINEPTAITITESITDAGCAGGSAGVIDISVSGGTGPYTYSWSNGAITEDLVGLTYGNYSVTVTDATGCAVNKTITVNEDASLVLTTTITNVDCNGNNTGEIDLEVAGGTAPYTYTWDDTGASTTQDLNFLQAGTYSVIVEDAAGCTSTASVVITEPNVLTLTATPAHILCNGDATGSINLTVAGGTGPFTYNWSNGETTQDISNLVAGTYTVTVTDNNVCVETLSVNITEPTAIVLGTTQSNISCNGASDGSIDLTASGGAGGFTYVWSNGATTEDISGLSAGNYDVIVTDANGCTETTSVTITEPAVLTLSTTQVNVLCNGDATGSVDLTVSGGTGTYTYAWSNGDAIEDISGLTAGNYSVTVTDDNGCTASTSVVITQPTALSLSVSPTDVLCNGGATGNVNLSVSGGAGGYTYAWSNGETTEDLAGVTAGNYTVTVTDANGCTASVTATVNEPAPLTLSSSKVDVLCNGDATGSIDLTVSGGTVGYTYSWSNGATTQDISNLVAGTYTVTVTDANGCTANTSVTINEPTALNLTTNASNVSCQGNGDGSIDLNVTGGSGAYTYFWNTGATGQDLSGLSPGTYSVTVTDANGCTETTSVVITQPAALSLTVATSNVLCNGDASGAIDLTVAGGTGPYTYSWSNGETTQDLTGLVVNTYTVTVTDANGCTANTSAMISQPTALSLTTSKTDVLCNGDATGSIDLSVSGGTVGYTYLWSNGSTDQDLNNVLAGTYSVTVTDANGCTETTSVTINEPPALVINTSQVDVNCKGESNGSIDLTVTGGNGAYTYTWSNGETTEDLTSLAAGNYTITVTDENNCSATATITISEPPTLMTASYTQVNVLCNGDASGSIDLSIANATAPVSYAWSNGATTEDLNNITAGTYSVTVTDALGCITLSNIIISEPTALDLTSVKTDVDCNGNANGSIDISVSGGIGPYTYSWTNGASSQDLNNISSGSYSVTVTDANGCTIATTVVINEPPALTLSTTKVDVSCSGGSDGLVDLTVSGGTAPYTYAWNSGHTIQDLNDISAGTYQVTVTDANGCSQSSSVTVTEPGTELSASVSVTNIACKGQSTGAIDLTVTGGTAPYTYLWSFGATTEDVSSLPAGSYDVVITDDNNCLTITGITISEPAAALTINASTLDVSCSGGNDGAIDLTVSGGTAPYTYSWSNGSSAQDLSNLTAGTYMLTLTDANGCSLNSSYTITEPVDLSITLSKTDVTCFGYDNGAIDATVTGGTGPYTYTWSNGEASEDIASLVAGNYKLTVTDAQGCTASESVQIIEPTQITLTTAVTDAGCNGGTNGAIDLTVSGGTGPYTYNWSTGANSEDISGLSFGAYDVMVTDANGCSETLTVNVNEDASFNLALNPTPVSCNTGNDGAVDLQITGGQAPFNISWSNGAVSEDISGLTAGTYSVTVIDANGCTSITQVEVTEPEEITVQSSSTDILCNGSTDGEITLALEGGTAPYNITVSVLAGVGIQATVTDSNGCSPVVFGIESTATGFPATASASIQGSNLVVGNLGAGDYDITRPDLGGAVVVTETITEPASINITANATDVSCNGGTNGAIDLSVTGGTGTYTYLWSNGKTTADVVNLASGTYTVTVTDINGCTASASYTIDEPAPISISAGIQDVLCYGGRNGSINLSVSGGTGGYTYSWSNGSTSNLLSGISAGSYSVLVTDANGCTAEETFVVSQPTQIVIDVMSTNLTCFEAGDGAIDVSVSGGGGGYTYAWSNGEVSEDLNGLAAGTYTLLVTDANGCTAQKSVLITEPAVLAIAGSINQIGCFGANNGDIDITLSGGTGPYTFSWSNGANTEDVSGLSPGDYTVMVTDANGCTISETYQITQPTEISVSVAQQNILCSGAGTGTINLTVSGGAGSYQIDWLDGAQGPDRDNLTAGSYEATVLDANGCAVQVAVTITEPDPIVLSPAITHVGCNGEASGAITLNVSGGVGPYTYSWRNGGTTANLDQLLAGIYEVTVTDANNCIATAIVEVEQPAELTGTIVQTLNVNCDLRITSETILADIQGGTAPYTFSWDNEAFVSSENNTVYQDGTHEVVIRDANQCEIRLEYTVELPELGQSDLIITGLKDPQDEYIYNTPIVFEVEKTDNIVSWEWNLGDGNTSTEESFEYIYAEVGQYTVTLTTTDDLGCVQEHQINIIVDLGYEIVMPTAFTPNSDGLNDRLYPEYYGIRDIKLIIYNTWGEVIFVSEDIESGGWNGLVKDEEAPAGGYAYKLYAKSISGVSVERAGSFLLVKK